MKKLYSFFTAMSIIAIVASTSSCSDSDSNGGTTDNSAQLKSVNEAYVKNVVRPTYEGLLGETAKLKDAVEILSSQSDVDAACEAWRGARQYWEWSEAFLFGPAHNYGIDPHIDTWPFGVTAFNAYMKNNSPFNDEQNAANIQDAIRNGQNLTGFHAMEYLLFREGENRNFTEFTEDEKLYIKWVADDLYLSAVRLVAYWGGEITNEQSELLEKEDYAPEEDYGLVFMSAGSTARYPSVESGSTAIIAGCCDIINEVAESKIGQPYDGTDENYIESPHSYNSIQDFYDNIIGCKYALNGAKGAMTPQENSVMAYALKIYPNEAKTVQTAMDEALDLVKAMKQPFVKNYHDASAGEAIAALNNLNKALKTLAAKYSE